MADENAKPKQEPTKRVVIKREKVLVLPDAITTEQIKDLQKAIRAVDKSELSGVLVEAWVEVGRREGHSKENAIEAYAGKPGTADAKPGAFKAPSERSWAGGLVYERPPEPLVERKALD